MLDMPPEALIFLRRFKGAVATGQSSRVSNSSFNSIGGSPVGALCILRVGAIVHDRDVDKFAGHRVREVGPRPSGAGGGALPVIMSFIRSSEKPTTTATITSKCAV